MDIPALSSRDWTGHAREMREDLLGVQLRFNREVGEIGRVKFFGLSAVIVNSPALVEEFLVEKAKFFRKSPALRMALHPLIGRGLFTSDFDLWKQQRRLMAPLFHTASLSGYAGDMSAAAERCAATWRDGDELDLAREMTRITMSIAGKTLFDAETFVEADALGGALTVALQWSAAAAQSLGFMIQSEIQRALERKPRRDDRAGWLSRPILFPTQKNRALKAALRLLDERVARMIRERRERPDARHDLLARLLSTGMSNHEVIAINNDESSAAPERCGMTDQQLRDEILTLFVAGHETTATALTWALYLLARHPDALARLEREVAALDGRTPSFGDLAKLPYALRVFKESLRLYPPVPIFERTALEPVTLGGHRIPRGGYVSVLPFALHHRPEVWPDPERFDPDRFTPEAEAARSRYAFVPFGAGPRVCIGNAFALMEGPLVLATILQRARFTIQHQGELRVDPAAATLRPLGGLPARVRLRSEAQVA
jgi:cytochrome P450